MKLLLKEELYTVSGGSLENKPFYNTCTSAVINVLKYRNDMLEAFLADDLPAREQAATKMHHFQTIVAENCDFEHLRNSGAIRCDLLLI